MAPVPHPFDVVVTTNSGFPLDQNLYQAVKGLAAGAAVVRPGGTIICAAECRDGFPDHGSYREVLASQPSPEALLREIEARPHTVADQWQVQVQARIQSRARVVMCTAGLTGPQLASAHMDHTDDVTAAVRDELGRARTGRDAVRAAGRPADHPLRGGDMKLAGAALPGLREATGRLMPGPDLDGHARGGDRRRIGHRSRHRDRSPRLRGVGGRPRPRSGQRPERGSSLRRRRDGRRVHGPRRLRCRRASSAASTPW